MKLRKKTLVGVMAVACAAVMAVGSFAYFTDRTEASVTAKAGTMNINTKDVTFTQTDATVATLKPGEGVKFDYTLANDGNKSADILETIVLTSTVAMTAGAPEFQIYNAGDVTITDGVATPNTGAVGLGTLSSDRKQITYAIPEYILNGSGDNAEVEESVAGASKTHNFVIVFKNDAANTYQNITLTLDYEAQAKQHRNTDSTTWTTVKSQSITWAGNAGWTAVPEAN